jgi:hypothetical protein
LEAFVNAQKTVVMLNFIFNQYRNKAQRKPASRVTNASCLPKDLPWGHRETSANSSALGKPGGCFMPLICIYLMVSLPPPQKKIIHTPLAFSKKYKRESNMTDLETLSA